MFRRRFTNRQLTTEAYELTPRGGYVRMLLLTLVVIVVTVLAGGGVRYYADRFAPGSELAGLRRDNAELRNALEKARFDLELDRATRNELERQLAGLTEKLRQTEEELAFVKANVRQPGR